MDIAGHVSRQMLARYSHIRMEAKRKALESIVSKPAPRPRPASLRKSTRFSSTRRVTQLKTTWRLTSYWCKLFAGMGYGSEYRVPLFERLCTEVPELRKLEDDVIRSTAFLMMEDPRPTTQSDTDMIWYVLFKPRVVGLVGWEAKTAIAGTTEAYDAVTDYLYRALAPSEETLGENSGAADYQRRYDREQENWDGSEDSEPDFINAERIMRILVERLGLPTTEAYLDRVSDQE